jgi:hypothetical protein
VTFLRRPDVPGSWPANGVVGTVRMLILMSGSDVGGQGNWRAGDGTPTISYALTSSARLQYCACCLNGHVFMQIGLDGTLQ